MYKIFNKKCIYALCIQYMHGPILSIFELGTPFLESRGGPSAAVVCLRDLQVQAAQPHTCTWNSKIFSQPPRSWPCN